MNTRVASKVTDRLALVLEYLEKAKPEEFTLTWDRIEDPQNKDEPGLFVMPILICKKVKT
jgi:hypothetical protein